MSSRTLPKCDAIDNAESSLVDFAGATSLRLRLRDGRADRSRFRSALTTRSRLPSGCMTRNASERSRSREQTDMRETRLQGRDVAEQRPRLARSKGRR